MIYSTENTCKHQLASLDNESISQTIQGSSGGKDACYLRSIAKETQGGKEDGSPHSLSHSRGQAGESEVLLEMGYIKKYRGSFPARHIPGCAIDVKSQPTVHILNE